MSLSYVLKGAWHYRWILLIWVVGIFLLLLLGEAARWTADYVGDQL